MNVQAVGLFTRLTHIWSVCIIHSKALEFTSFRKPHPFVFKNAETVLKKLQQTPHYLDVDGIVNNGETGHQTFRTLYMVGDNPSVDIKGARQVCS